MNCNEQRELIHAYADDELDVSSARSLDAHLHDCPRCRTAFEAIKAVKTAVANPALYHKAPADLRRQIMKSIHRDRASAPPAARWRIPWLPLGLAASILVVGLTAYSYLGRSQHSQFTLEEQEIIDSHIRSLQSPQETHLYDVKSTDQHTVKPWFDQHVDFSPSVKQLSPDGYPLLGGRLDYIRNHPVAALVYGRAKHTINLFIWPGESGQGNSVDRGFNIIHWSKDGMTYWAVSDLNTSELEQFTHLIQAGASPKIVPH